jgi:Ubiquitin family
MEGTNVAVTFRGTTHRFDLLPDTLLSTLQAELESLTGVPTSLQKLIHKGKKFQDETSTTTLAQAGIRNGMKIQMLGTTVKDLDGMKGVEDERQKRDRILRERAMKPAVKVRQYL